MPSFISIPVNGIVTDGSARVTKTYEIDFDRGCFTGRMIDGLDAVKQFIKKALLTPRFKCLIYSADYGSQIRELMSNAPSKKYLEASVAGYVEDAIIHDSRIKSISNFEYTYNDDFFVVSFNVQTIYGNTQIKEAI